MPEPAALLRARRFRDRVQAGEALIGTFVKTPAPHLIEILSIAGFDFAVIDAEHAPFGRSELDSMALAAGAADFPLLVRTPINDTALIGAVLDMGFAGIVAPHIKDRHAAEAVVAAALISRDRGLSPSPRAGGYGALGFCEYAKTSDAAVSVWAQIEDKTGVQSIEDIAQTEGLDCCFIGRVDLAHALGETSTTDELTDQSTHKVISACVAAKRAAALFVSDPQEITRFKALGANIFIIGSDQSLLKKAAAEAVIGAR